MAVDHGALDLQALMKNRRQNFFPDGIFKLLQPSIVWHAVPKRRRSLEKRQTRRFFYKFFESAKPKANLVPCTECGNWFERQYCCPHCYSRVRFETEKAKEALGEDQFKYSFPTSEISLTYQGEGELAEKMRKSGKMVLELDRPRPKWWFGNNLLTKSNK